MNRMQHDCPRLEVPSPLQASETGTWTHTSVVKRLPDVGQRILNENEFDKKSKEAIISLIGEIPYGKIRFLEDGDAADFSEWNKIIGRYEGNNWLDVPWLFVEFYFYRRVLEAIGYFDVKRNFGYDPYKYQKEQGVLVSERAIKDICNDIETWQQDGTSIEQQLNRLLKKSLWGNQLDLSIWPANEESDRNYDYDKDDISHIVVDQSTAVVNFLIEKQQEINRIDFILDNAGFELVCDLVMADFLLRAGFAKKVYFHTKAMPTYVSDTMVFDVKQTVAYFMNSPHQEIRRAGQRLSEHITCDRLIFTDHLFWTSSQRFWDMPEDLQKELAKSSLLVFKGDANFRRLLGDAHWKFSTSFSDIVCYFPVPVLALRVYKSEVASEITDEQVEQLNRIDKDWMTNGQWGMILWYDGKS